MLQIFASKLPSYTVQFGRYRPMGENDSAFDSKHFTDLRRCEYTYAYVKFMGTTGWRWFGVRSRGIFGNYITTVYRYAIYQT